MQKELKSNSVVVSDAGSTFYVTSQAFQPIKNQRYITSGAQADMGFTLPAAIGAAFAQKDRMIVGITGDGSFQMNIQELQTLIHYKIPVKLVIWNNDGYLSIRQTQKKFFSGREIGTDKNSGVSFPSTKKIASAYNIPYVSSKSVNTLRKTLSRAFSIKGPVIIEIFCPPMQEIIPTASSTKLPDGRMISKPLEDMYPFLSRDEFYGEMIIEPIKE
jgi:acetolactate synthase-1/2/3 large subunit